MTGRDDSWLVLSDAQWDTWAQSSGLIHNRCVRWDEAIATPEAVRSLRVLVAGTADKPASLPAALGTLPALERLELPAQLLRSAAGSDFPASLRALRATGQGAVTIAPGLRLTSLRELLAGQGPLRFDPDQLPSLESITLRMDKRAPHAPGIVRSYPGLRELGCVAPHDPAVFAGFAKLPLTKLGISGGNIEDLDLLTAFSTLEELNISRLPHLTSLAPLAELPTLTRLSITYCPKATDFEALSTLPGLSELTIVGCGDVGPVRAKLDALGLASLQVSA